MPKEKKLESELYYEALVQANPAAIFESVLDRAETAAKGVFATDISTHALEIRKLVDSFSSEKKSRFAPASYTPPLLAAWALLLVGKSALSEKEVAQTLTFAAMHFGAALEQANLWPKIQEFGSWKAALKANSSKAVRAKRAKSEERRNLCRSLAKEDLGNGSSGRKAALRISRLIRSKNLLDDPPPASTVRADIGDLFPPRR